MPSADRAGAARSRRGRGRVVARIAVERAEALVEQGKKGSKEWTTAAEAATRAQRDLAVAQARRAELVAQPGAAPGRAGTAGRGRQGPRRRSQGLGPRPGEAASAAQHELHRRRRDDLSRDQHGAPARLRSLDHGSSPTR